MNGRLILDIQPGRPTPSTRCDHLRNFIQKPDVDVALDAEWNVGPREEPGEDLGSLGVEEGQPGGEDAQAHHRATTTCRRSPDHPPVPRGQREGGAAGSTGPATVDITLNFDGIGSPSAKRPGYRTLSFNGLFNGFSLFYELDQNLMSPRPGPRPPAGARLRHVPVAAPSPGSPSTLARAMEPKPSQPHRLDRARHPRRRGGAGGSRSSSIWARSPMRSCRRLSSSPRATRSALQAHDGLRAAPGLAAADRERGGGADRASCLRSHATSWTRSPSWTAAGARRRAGRLPGGRERRGSTGCATASTQPTPGDAFAYAKAQAELASAQLERLKLARHVGFTSAAGPLRPRAARAPTPSRRSDTDPSAPPTVSNPPTGERPDSGAPERRPTAAASAAAAGARGFACSRASQPKPSAIARLRAPSEPEALRGRRAG